MTSRLQEALRRVEALSPDEQDEIANLVLDRLDLPRIERAGAAEFDAARRRALANLRRGFNLGGRPLTREEAHAR